MFNAEKKMWSVKMTIQLRATTYVYAAVSLLSTPDKPNDSHFFFYLPLSPFYFAYSIYHWNHSMRFCFFLLFFFPKEAEKKNNNNKITSHNEIVIFHLHDMQYGWSKSTINIAASVALNLDLTYIIWFFSFIHSFLILFRS